jgi:hypothetical protein
MGTFIGLCVFFFFIVLVLRSASARTASVRRFDRLQASGRRGRALVLSASPLVKGITINGRRFQQRQMTIEVEVDGFEPYEVTDTFAVPRGFVEAIPGSSLDVAVDLANRRNVAVLGPGGFTGPWLQCGPPLPY